MKIDDAPLTRYLVKQLQPLTKADPTLLANYVIALLENNKSKKELQKLCVDQMFDFLGEDTRLFVLELFHALEDGTIQAFREEPDLKQAVAMGTVATTSRLVVPTTMKFSGGHAPLKVSSQSEKGASVNNQSYNAQEVGSDDEDDDRNHKHQRRLGNSDPLNKDISEEGLRVSSRKRSWLAEDGLFLERCKGMNHMETDSVVNNQRRQGSGPTLCAGRETHNCGGSRGAQTFQSEGTCTLSRFENQIALPHGIFGRGRGAMLPRNCLGPRSSPFDTNDFGACLAPTASTSLCSGILVTSRGNPPHLPWGGYGHNSGMPNGPMEPILPANTAMMQGSRGIQKATGLDVGVSMGLGMILKRPRCSDFEERGYCLRGDLCPMEHGANRIVVEDVQSLSKFNLSVGFPSKLGVTGSVVPIPGEPSSSFSSSNGFKSRVGSTLGRQELGGLLDVEVGTKPDLYDPDEPLWIKDYPIEGDRPGDRLGRLSASGKDRAELFWESSASKCCGESFLNTGYVRSTTTVRDFQGRVPGKSVRDCMGLSQTEAEGNNHPSICFVDSPLHTNTLKEEAIVNVEVLGSWDNGNGAVIGDRQEQMRSPIANMSEGNGDGMTQQLATAVDTSGGFTQVCEGKTTHGAEMAHRTLFIRCIPTDKKKKELLLAHFRKFGEIMDIRVPMHGDRAFIQFSRRENAEAALLSSEAVMGNRFIRLSWAKRDSIQSSNGEGNFKGTESTLKEKDSSHLSLPTAAGPSCWGSTPPESAIRSVILNLQQPSLGFSEQKRKVELEQMKEELRRKQEEFTQKRIEFRLKLEHLMEQNISVKGASDLDQNKGKHFRVVGVQGLNSCSMQEVTKT